MLLWFGDLYDVKIVELVRGAWLTLANRCSDSLRQCLVVRAVSSSSKRRETDWGELSVPYGIEGVVAIKVRWWGAVLIFDDFHCFPCILLSEARLEVGACTGPGTRAAEWTVVLLSCVPSLLAGYEHLFWWLVLYWVILTLVLLCTLAHTHAVALDLLQQGVT